MDYIIKVMSYYRAHIQNEDTTSLSYYFLLSLIPAITLLAFLSHLLHIDLTIVKDMLYQVFTHDIALIIENALFDQRISYLSIVTIFVSLYICSKGIYRLIRKVNELYHYESPFYLKLKIHSLMDTFLVLILILVLIVIVGVIPMIMSLLNLDAILVVYKYIGGFAFLFMVLLIVFYLVPSTKVSIKEIWVGTLFTTISFILIIFGINIYLKYANYSNIYGYFASIAVLLLTCDFFAKGLYLGFVINALRKM